MDFGTFSIDELIMHHVPHGSKSGADRGEVTLCSALVDLHSEDKQYLESKIKTFLKGNARPAIENPNLASPTPAVIRELIAGDENFINDSQSVAKTLHEHHPWMSPEGLFIFSRGTITGSTCVLVAKLEHEEGVRVDQMFTEDQKLTYKTEYLKNLIFGDGTRVYKIGIFWETNEDNLLIGHVSDSQNGKHGVASYFLAKVLGCEFQDQDDLNTQRFFEAVETWSSDLNNPEEEARYEVALIAELQSPRETLNVTAFANQYIDANQRDSFMTVMRESNVVTTPIPKDITLVSRKINRVKFQTSRGATVFVTRDMYDDGSVTIKKSDTGSKSEIRIIDEVTSISAAGGKQIKKAP